MVGPIVQLNQRMLHVDLKGLGVIAKPVIYANTQQRVRLVPWKLMRRRL